MTTRCRAVCLNRISMQGMFDPARLVFIDESVLQSSGRSSKWTNTVREAA